MRLWHLSPGTGTYQEDNMAAGGYGYGGDGGYDAAYDDEYPAQKPYPHPGKLSLSCHASCHSTPTQASRLSESLLSYQLPLYYWITNLLHNFWCFSWEKDFRVLLFQSQSKHSRDISIGSFVSASPWDMLVAFFTCTAENISGMFTVVLKRISVFSGKLFNICDHFFEKCLPYFLILTT